MPLTESPHLHSTEVITKPKSELFDYHFALLTEHEPERLKVRLVDKIAKQSINARLIKTALEISTDAHKNQKRKFTDDPYIVHPLRVALLSIKLAEAIDEPVTEELIIGALLHDVIEDNREITQAAIIEKFSQFDGVKPGLAEIFAADSEALNQNSPFDEGGKLSSQLYHDKITDTDDADAIKRRKIIKAADRWDNLLDPTTLEPEFALRDGKTAINFRKSRISYIQRTQDPQGLIPILLKDEEFLLNVVLKATNISQQTIEHSNFDSNNWSQHLPSQKGPK